MTIEKNESRLVHKNAKPCQEPRVPVHVFVVGKRVLQYTSLAVVAVAVDVIVAVGSELHGGTHQPTNGF
jgi:hypothetical protein